MKRVKIEIDGRMIIVDEGNVIEEDDCKEKGVIKKKLDWKVIVLAILWFIFGIGTLSLVEFKQSFFVILAFFTLSISALYYPLGKTGEINSNEEIITSIILRLSKKEGSELKIQEKEFLMNIRLHGNFFLMLSVVTATMLLLILGCAVIFAFEYSTASSIIGSFLGGVPIMGYISYVIKAIEKNSYHMNYAKYLCSVYVQND